MRRLLALVCLAVVGFCSGITVGAFNTGLVPLCGDPCGAKRLGQSVIWGLSLLVVFPLIGNFAIKKLGGSLIKIFTIAIVLSFLVLFPAASIYGYKLHKLYWQSPAILGVPDVDYSYMTIATKPVTATYGTSSVKIKAWERCVLGPVYCDKQPRAVQAICLDTRKAVLIKESDWPTFQRIPEEDLQGLLDRPKDMHLCSNHVE